MEPVEINPERQKLAKEYSRIRHRLMLVDLGIAGIYVTAWLVSGLALSLRDAIVRITLSDWIQVALFGMVFGGAYFLINLPLTYYSGFILPQRFGQSNESRRGWIADQGKGLLIGGLLGGLMLEVVYAVLRAFPETWWLWAAGLMLIFNVLLANLAPVLLYPIFYKFVPLGEEYRDLAERLVRLSERAGTKVQGVFQFDMSRRMKAANAALTGLGNTRRIILGDTLLTEFTADEIESVLAHELGHHVNRDIPLSMAYETLSTVAGLWLTSLALKWGAGAFVFGGPADIAALPVFAMAMGLFGLVTMPLSNAFSRWRERLADRYALESTRNPRAFAAAMTRLANQNLGELDPEPWVETLLYSHPALGRRIRMAQEYEHLST